MASFEVPRSNFGIEEETEKIVMLAVLFY